MAAFFGAQDFRVLAATDRHPAHRRAHGIRFDAPAGALRVRPPINTLSP
jgi:hypothetical protein